MGVQAGANSLWQIAGGSNSVANINIGVNSGSSGSLFISNGVVIAANLSDSDGGVGNVTVAGGKLVIGTYLLAGYLGATGAVWQTGGEIDVLGKMMLLTESGIVPYDGQIVCSGGVLNATEVDIGHNTDPNESSGTLMWNIAGGTSTVSSAVYVVGSGPQSGLVNVSGGRLQTALLELGYGEPGGSVTISGGQIQVTSRMDVGVVPGTASVINVTGGNLELASISSPGSEFPGFIGSASGGQAGIGQVNVSSGSFTGNFIEVGAAPGSVGTLNVSGGLVDGSTGTFGFGTTLLVGEAGATGAVSYTGGNLNLKSITVGDAGFGSLSVSSNANFKPLGMRVGNQNGGVGLATFQGGTLSAFGPVTRQMGDLEIGLQAGSTGAVWVSNGALQAGTGCSLDNNAAAIGELGSGRLTATNSWIVLTSPSIGVQGTLQCVNSQVFIENGGCAAINNNVMLFVTSTGTFDSMLQNNATLVANGSTLEFQQPVNNSGWIIATNGWLLFQSSVTNSGAIMLGPDQFRVTSVTATGSDAAITWQAFGGNDYRVQAGANLVGGFSDISTDIVATGNGPVVTNFIDHGALTNSTRRFYRVRQIP